MTNNKDKKVLNVPNLRFSEFTGEWKKCIIGELTTKVGSGVTPRGGEAVYKSEGHPFVRSQNVGLGHLILDDIAYIDEDTHQRQKNTELQLDDVLLNITGASIGRSALVNQQIVGGNVNQHVCIIRANKKLIPSFLCNFLLSQYCQKQIESFQAGGNRQGLNFEQIKSIKIGLPSVEEQKKIADLLLLIEQRIITQNKIIEKLQSLIKGIIVTHYSTTAHTIKVKIRELGEAYSTMVMSKEQLTNDGNLCVFYGELFTLYGCVIDKVKSRTSLEKVSSTLSHGRDLLFPASTTVDAVSLIAPSALMQKGIILGGDMFGIKVSEAYNPIYLSYYFNYIANKRLAKYAKGTTIIHLHYNEIANVAIELPNIEEQDKIVSTILEYSAKLSIEETILEKLFDLKQYLLKQLFI